MKVYIIEYGNVDTEEEGLCSIWKYKQDALNAAHEAAQEILNDLLEEGEDYSISVEHHGDGSTTVGLGDSEWWRVSEKEVKE